MACTKPLNEMSNNSETDNEISLSVFDVRTSDEESIPANDRFSKADRYHAIPPPIPGNFLTLRADISFAGLDEYAIRKKIIKSKTADLNTKTSETVGKTNEANTQKPKTVYESVNRDKVITEDWNSDDEDDVSEEQISKVDQNQPSVSTARPVCTARPSVSTARPVCTARPSVSTARPVCTARPSVSTARPVYATRPILLKNGQCKTKRLVFTYQEGNPEILLQDHAVVDSGCSSHMTGNKAYLLDYEDFNGGFVAFGSDPKGGKITGKGKIKTANLDFDDVYFVDELKFNLFSVSQMCDKKNSVLFTESECLILSPSFMLLDESQVVLRAPRKDDVYNLDLKNIVLSEGITCLYANTIADESKLWYRRLGHVNFKNINKLVKGHLVRGLPSKVFVNDHTCVACKKGKQHKASCKAKLERIIRKPLELLHMDLFGPVSVESINKKRYCLVVTDDFSRFSWVFFLATKDETSEILCNLIIGLEKQLNHNVKIIRCDNGTEFKNHAMNEFCAKKGIKREFSVARTPQQNGVAERKNRTLIKAARTMLADSLLPIPFWAEAVNTACYVLNRGNHGGHSSNGYIPLRDMRMVLTLQSGQELKKGSNPLLTFVINPDEECCHYGRQFWQKKDFSEEKAGTKGGRTSSVVLEEKESANKEVSTEAPISTVKPNKGTEKRNEGTGKQDGGADNTKVSTDRQGEGTADQNKGKNATQTAPTTTSTPIPTIFGNDETIAHVLIIMSQNKQKEKEKGVEIRNVEDTERPRPTLTRSILTLRPLPKIDPKDKGKKRIEEEDESGTIAKVQEEWEAEDEKKRLDEEEATKAALSNEYDFIQARLNADKILAKKLQEEEREMYTMTRKNQIYHDNHWLRQKEYFLKKQKLSKITSFKKLALMNQMMTIFAACWKARRF
ncbi:putative ribonuclease H-like domain-containing protein [Tanacetum coccineum]